jgi:hypothetical protein
MNIREKLAEGHSKTITAEIVDYVGQNEVRFKELLSCVLCDNMRLSHRASWALGDVSLRYPTLYNQHHRVLLDALKTKQNHNAIRRNIVRIYQFAEIPEEYEAELYDICLNFVADAEEMTAVKAFGMRVCERVIERYPEMKNEMLEIIKSNQAQWSSGLKNRGKKFLEKWG